MPDALREQFLPEFLNHVDETVVFHSLTQERLKHIVDIQLGHLRDRLGERQISIELSERAKEYFVQTGYDPTYDARPLKRLLQKEIEAYLGRQIIGGELTDHSHVSVYYDGQTLTIDSAPLAAAA